jgi:malate/lactate dehydrogenase
MKWVISKPLMVETKMPLWPFVKVNPPISPDPLAQPDPNIADIRNSIKRIEEIVEALSQRPSPAAPEIVAAHVRNIQQLTSIPVGLPGGPHLPGPGAAKDPLFIPSRIAPEDVETNIKVREEQIDKQNMDESVEALKKLKRKGESNQ